MKRKNTNEQDIHALQDRLDITIRHIHLVDKTLDALVDLTSKLIKRVEKLERRK